MVRPQMGARMFRPQMCVQRDTISSLLLAVVAVGVGAGAVAAVDEAEGGVPVLRNQRTCIRKNP